MCMCACACACVRVRACVTHLNDIKTTCTDISGNEHTHMCMCKRVIHVCVHVCMCVREFVCVAHLGYIKTTCPDISGNEHTARAPVVKLKKILKSQLPSR